MNNSTTRTYLQDAVVTMRDGRYCLPVKAEAKGNVQMCIRDRGWLVLDFLAETLYMHIDSACVADIFIAPYVVQKLLPCKHLIWR